MKKSFRFLFSVVLSISFSVLSTGSVGWDERYGFAYNKEKFPQGIFDEGGVSLVKVESSRCFCAWDLHGVVLKTNTWPILLSVLLTALAKTRGVGEVLVLLGKHYCASYDIRAEQKERGIQDSGLGEAMYYAFLEHRFSGDECAHRRAEKYLRRFYDWLPLIDWRVVKIMHRLHQQGVHTTIFSNMGAVEARKTGNVFARISEAATTPTRKEQYRFLSTLFLKQESFFVSLASYLLKKPAQDAYRHLFQKNLSPYDFRLFVDDNLENVKAAVAHGFDVAIHFKNKEQLLLCLEKLGFL